MKTYTDRHEVLAQLLRDLRNQAGLTQTELANALEKPQSYVSKYESNERRLDLVEVADVCKALSIPLSELVSAFAERTA